MTTPTDYEDTSGLTGSSQSGTEDIPLATVNGFGVSEALSLIVVLGGLLTAIFGHDFGVAKNAQALAVVAVALASFGTSIGRAIKHHGVVHANAAVLAAQVQALSQGVTLARAAAPVKAARRRPSGDSGEGALYVIGLILTAIGALLLIIGAIHGVLSVTGLVLLIIGVVLLFVRPRTGGGLRL